MNVNLHAYLRNYFSLLKEQRWEKLPLALSSYSTGSNVN